MWHGATGPSRTGIRRAFEDPLPMNSYERLFRPLLFSLDPETAHRLTIELLRGASHFDLALRVLRFFQPPSKPKTLFGLNFPNPIGLTGAEGVVSVAARDSRRVWRSDETGPGQDFA